MTHYLIDNQPEEWNQLAVIYDKDGAYKQSYIESKMRNQAATVDTVTKVNDGKLENGKSGEITDQKKN